MDDTDLADNQHPGDDTDVERRSVNGEEGEGGASGDSCTPSVNYNGAPSTTDFVAPPATDVVAPGRNGASMDDAAAPLALLALQPSKASPSSTTTPVTRNNNKNRSGFAGTTTDTTTADSTTTAGVPGIGSKTDDAGGEYAVGSDVAGGVQLGPRMPDSGTDGAMSIQGASAIDVNTGRVDQQQHQQVLADVGDDTLVDRAGSTTSNDGDAIPEPAATINVNGQLPPPLHTICQYSLEVRGWYDCPNKNKKKNTKSFFDEDTQTLDGEKLQEQRFIFACRCKNCDIKGDAYRKVFSNGKKSLPREDRDELQGLISDDVGLLPPDARISSRQAAVHTLQNNLVRHLVEEGVEVDEWPEIVSDLKVSVFFLFLACSCATSYGNSPCRFHISCNKQHRAMPVSMSVFPRALARSGAAMC